MSDIEPDKRTLDAVKMTIAILVESYGNDLEGLLEEIANSWAKDIAYIELLVQELRV